MSKKIYVVTSGEYSDYSIQRVYSTKQMAEEFCDRYDDDFRIEEYNLDEDLPPREEIVFKIAMDLETKEVYAPSTLSDEWNNLFRIDGDNQKGRICFAVKTDSKAKAIKIASERYAEVIANEQFKFPFLRAGVIRYFGSIETPFYDFKTGEIVIVRGSLAYGLPPFAKYRNLYKKNNEKEGKI